MLILGSAVAPLITLSGFMCNARYTHNPAYSPRYYYMQVATSGTQLEAIVGCRSHGRINRSPGGMRYRPCTLVVRREDFTSMSFLAACMKSRVCTEEYGYMGTAREVCAVIHGRLRKSHLCFTYRIHLPLLFSEICLFPFWWYDKMAKLQSYHLE